jgi:hypothetical protein
MSTIELMLNPLEENHQKLNSLMKDAVDQLRSPSAEGGIEARVEIICRDITQVSQGILKREWARVKRGE